MNAEASDGLVLCTPCRNDDHLYCAEGQCQCECREAYENEEDSNDDEIL